MQGKQIGSLLNGDDQEINILVLDGTALDEAGGGIPGIGVFPVPPAVVLGAIVDDVVAGVKNGINAALTITKIF